MSVSTRIISSARIILLPTVVLLIVLFNFWTKKYHKILKNMFESDICCKGYQPFENIDTLIEYYEFRENCVKEIAERIQNKNEETEPGEDKMSHFQIITKHNARNL